MQQLAGGAEEEGGGRSTENIKRRKSNTNGDGSQEVNKRRRTGRPPNDPGPPLPATPRTLAPRPRSSAVPILWPELAAPEPRPRPVGRAQGLAPEESGPTLDDSSHANQRIVSDQAFIMANHNYFAVPASASQPEARAVSFTGPSLTTTPRASAHLPSRPPRPIASGTLGPNEFILDEVAILGRNESLSPPEFQCTIHNVLVSDRFGQSVASHDLIQRLGAKCRDINASEIRRLVTPRGTLHCTKWAYICFWLPNLMPPQRPNYIRVLVLPEEHRGLGAPLFIGNPWMAEEGLLPMSSPPEYVPQRNYPAPQVGLDVTPSHLPVSDDSAIGHNPNATN